jgi:hypothetical protein
MAWTGRAEMLRKKVERVWVGGRRGNREMKEERKRDRRLGVGKEEVAFSGLTVGPLLWS